MMETFQIYAMCMFCFGIYFDQETSLLVNEGSLIRIIVVLLYSICSFG